MTIELFKFGTIFSTRETEVAALIAEGWDNDEISRRLIIEPKTVQRHLSNIYEKMGDMFDCDNRTKRTFLAYLFHKWKAEI